MKDNKTRFSFLNSFFSNIKESIRLVSKKLFHAFFGSTKSSHIEKTQIASTTPSSKESAAKSLEKKRLPEDIKDSYDPAEEGYIEYTRLGSALQYREKEENNALVMPTIPKTDKPSASQVIAPTAPRTVNPNLLVTQKRSKTTEEIGEELAKQDLKEAKEAEEYFSWGKREGSYNQYRGH